MQCLLRPHHVGFKQSSTLRKKLIQGNVVQAIAELARTSAFVVLQNDSIMALTLILADSDTETAKDMLMHGTLTKSKVSFACRVMHNYTIVTSARNSHCSTS